MNEIDVNLEQVRQGFFADRLFDILSELSYAEENNCLKVAYNSVVFLIHFNQGQLVYATNSLAPFERLERHLRRLKNQNPQIDNSTIELPRRNFKNDLQAYTQFPTDYQSIIWLLEQNHLSMAEAVTLIRRVTREVFESFLCLPYDCPFKLIARSNQIKELCRFDLKAYIEQCEKRLEGWQAFAEKITSSYQRPYLITEKEQTIDGLSKVQNQTICKLLRGLNFRQISAVIDCDELVVTKILYPSLENSTIILRNPKSPFDLLPNLRPKENISELALDSDWHGQDSGFQVSSHSKQTIQALEKTWQLAYVDNNTSAQQSLRKCLQFSFFAIAEITDPMEAFTQLIEQKPDLILLNSTMPHLNGYELCELLRNHHSLKQIPIIMVEQTSEHANDGRAKRAGANASIAKPFDRSQLLDTIWQRLQ